MSIFQIYLRDGIEDKFLKEYKHYKVSENIAFIKTDQNLTTIIKHFGLNQEQEITGIVCRINSMNGWYNKDLWDWESNE